MVRQCKHCNYIDEQERMKDPVDIFSTENWIARSSDWSHDWENKDREKRPYVCRSCGKLNY